MLPGLLRGEEKAEAAPPISDHPQFVLRATSFSKDHETLSFVGSLGDMDDASWNHWKKNTAKIPHRDKVKAIFLNYGYISEVSLSYLCGFENVEFLTLGISIEGVTISSDTLKQLAGFRKLQYLTIAIHGLSGQHLNAISEGCGNLKELSIQFPSVHMITDDKPQMERWKAVSLDDGAVEEISKIKSLESIWINHTPDESDGQVRFSEKALLTLIKMPKLKSLCIRSDNFTKEGMKAIDKLNLPLFIKIPKS